MNKSLSLTALLFLTGPTLLTYGSNPSSERSLENSTSIYQRALEQTRKLGRKLFHKRDPEPGKKDTGVNRGTKAESSSGRSLEAPQLDDEQAYQQVLKQILKQPHKQPHKQAFKPGKEDTSANLGTKMEDTGANLGTKAESSSRRSLGDQKLYSDAAPEPGKEDAGANLGTKMEDAGANFGTKMKDAGANFGTKMEDAGANFGTKNAISYIISEAIIQELLQRYCSSFISKKINHFLLDGNDVAALSSTAILKMIFVAYHKAMGSKENQTDFTNVSKDLVMRLTGKYVGRKFVTAIICAINWYHRTLRDGDLINAVEHQYSIKRMQDVAGLIGSATGDTVLTSLRQYLSFLALL